MNVAIVVDERDLLLLGSCVVHQDLELLGNWNLLAGALSQPQVKLVVSELRRRVGQGDPVQVESRKGPTLLG